MQRANVGIRSNVMTGRASTVVSKQALRGSVRGAAAVRIVLKVLGGAPSLASLTPAQLAELSQEIPCSVCGVRPEGPVKLDGQIVLEVRCPLQTCKSAARVRSVRLDRRALAQLTDNAREGDLSAAIDRLFRNGPDLDRRRGLEGSVVPFVARLSPSTFYLVRGIGEVELSQVIAGLLDLQP